MTMKGQNIGTEFRMYANSKGANWKGLENFMRNNPDFTIKHISKSVFDDPKAIDFSYKKSTMMEDKGDKHVVMKGNKFYTGTEFVDDIKDAMRYNLDSATMVAKREKGMVYTPKKMNENSAEETLAGKIAKALKDKANKDASDQSNLKQARTALNKGNLDAAKKIADPYLEEGLPKGFWDKKMKAKDETNESYETLKKKIQSQGKSAKAAAQEKGGEDKYMDFLGFKIKRSDVRNMPQNLSMSAVTMGTGILSGIVAGAAVTPETFGVATVPVATAATMRGMAVVLGGYI